jgi:RES domain-containing protein
MIYTSEHYSTAMLEKLVRGSGGLPPNQHYIEITIPNGITYEQLNEAQLPNWADAAASASKLFGEKWQQERRSLLLIVPSVVARVDNNFLINPDHSDFARLTHSLHKPVWWDARLFGSAP